jgi:hypothetical protein
MHETSRHTVEQSVVSRHEVHADSGTHQVTVANIWTQESIGAQFEKTAGNRRKPPIISGLLLRSENIQRTGRSASAPIFQFTTRKQQSAKSLKQ